MIQMYSLDKFNLKLIPLFCALFVIAKYENACENYDWQVYWEGDVLH